MGFVCKDDFRGRVEVYYLRDKEVQIFIMQQQNSSPRQNQLPYYNSHIPQTQPPQNVYNPQIQMPAQLPQGQSTPNYPQIQFPQNHPQGQPYGQTPEPLSPYKPNQQQSKESVINPPSSPAEFLDHIKKNPYTQMLAGQQMTYSILPKKQQTLFGTNNRVLILKGLESIAYARELPANRQVPFNSFQDVPQPKASFPISEIEKCQAIDQKLSIKFSGVKKAHWQFECPTKGCAVQWAKKIDNATLTLNDFKQSGYHSLEQFLRNRKDIDLKRRLQGFNQVNNLLNNQFESQKSNNLNMNVSFNQNPPSPMKAINYEGASLSLNNSNGLSHSKTVPLGSNINQTSNLLQQSALNLLSSPQKDFIANQATYYSYEPEKMLGKSMSKITSFEKEGIRLQLARMRRNWLQELVGGEEEVELIMDFKNYVQRIASVLINQLYISNQHKIFPPIEQTKEHAAYLLEDVYLEVYIHTQDTQDRKHPRYQLAALQFKNMDYLLSVTKNEGNLKVPFMVLFEYKGFLGMAKSRVADPNAPHKNRQFYGQLNIRDFEDTARINAETLLNQNKCKIVAYERKTPLSATMSNRRIYFVDSLTELLPVEKQYDNNPCKVLRAELLQDDSFQGLIFRDKRRPIYPQKLNQLIERKVDEFIRMVQQEEEYFTNSKELAQLIHLSGLNVRHLGRIYLKTRLGWFRKILQAQIIARSIKSLFRYDIQNIVMIQADRQANKNTQEQAEKRRVISFLNVLFGNSESTSGIWKRINAISRDKFGVVVAENSIGDTNVQFLMQAVQTHLKIIMNESIHSKLRFQSTQTFEPKDFQRFEFKSTIYDLQFSNLFDQIDQCLTSQTPESFYNLSAILIKETSTRIPYIDILRNHPIHDRISEFLLNFTSPAESKQLYSRLELGLQPSRFLYESKLAEIKWFLKANKPEHIKQISTFIFQHARRWLGAIHPLFAQLNRLQASYYSNYIQYHQTALKHANESLDMQRKIFDRQAEPLWKDYFLLGKIYFNNRNTEEGMKYLLKAKELVNARGLKQLETYSELNLLLCKGFFASQRYREAYNIVKDLYGLIKTDKDERVLSYSLEAVKWIKQLFQINQDHASFLQFLETEVAANMKAFVEYPNVLTLAIKMVALPSLKHAVVRRSRNPGRLMGLCEDVGKIAESTKNSLAGYIKERILEGSFPRSFLIHLKEIDMIFDEIAGMQMLDRWRQFYMTSSQFALDSLGTSQVPRGFEFLASLTALFNLLGRQVLDELHLIDRR